MPVLTYAMEAGHVAVRRAVPLARIVVFSVLACVLGGTFAGRAHAEGPAAGSASATPSSTPSTPALSSPSSDAHAQAKVLHEEGEQHLTAGRYAEAVTAFDASYRAEATASALYNMGLAYKAMGRPDKALEAFEAFLKFADAKSDATHIGSGRSEVDAIKAGYARFVLQLTPANATIEIDGAPAHAENGELWVPIGNRSIKIRATDYETYQQRLDVAAGRFDLEVHLRQPTLPPDQRAATIVDEAMALHAAGSLNDALERYRDAYALFPTPRGTAQMGLCEETLGDLGSAQLHIDDALKAKKDTWIREKKKDLRAAQKRIKREAGTLSVSGSPDGAEVFIDARSVGTLPLFAPLRLVRGSHKVLAKKAGYTDIEQVVDLPAHGNRQVVITLAEAPPPVIVPMPFPQPVVAVPALVAPVAALPPPEAPIAPKPEKRQPGEKSSQADIEAESDLRDDLKGEPDSGKDLAQGFEMALNFGYQPWIGGPKPDGSGGALVPQISLGGRIPWPLSFGLLLQGGFDTSVAGTKVVAAVNPGLYVRGHIQKHKRQPGFDVWGGTGIQPLAVQASVLEPKQIDPTTIDPLSLDEAGILELQRLAVKQKAGVDRVHSIQSINVPIELGATLYITQGFGIDLSMALTFWLPQQDCLHDDRNKLCTDTGLKSQTSLFIGGGLAFLP